MRELEAFNKIMETYGNTNSLEGTYNDFLTIKKALQRLEQIDKLQEELGCPLETVFKALTNGIWIEEQNFRYYTSSRPSKMMKGYITDFRIEIEDFKKSYFNITVGKKLCFNWRDNLWLYDEKYILNDKSHELYERAFAVNDIDTDWDKNQKPFTLNSYKKNWWLKEDKSE